MPIDPSFVGRVYPPTDPYRVSREKIREFVDAIGDPDARYRDPEAARAAGYADVIAPPTFAVVLTLPAGAQVTADPALGLDYSRVVHAEQGFAHRRPLVAGDMVTVVVTVRDARVVAGNDMLTLSAAVSTVSGELVTTATSTLVARGADR